MFDLKESGDDFLRSFQQIYDADHVNGVLGDIGEEMVSDLQAATPVSGEDKEHLRDQWTYKRLRRPGRHLLIVGARIPHGQHAHRVMVGSKDVLQHVVDATNRKVTEALDDAV